MKSGITASPTRARLAFQLNKEPDLPGPSTYALSPASAGLLSLLRPPSESLSFATGTGILTCYPSTTPFGLALGTD